MPRIEEPTEHAEDAEAGYGPVTKSMTERGFSPGACYLVTECTEAEDGTQRGGASQFFETEWSAGSPAATPHALSLLRALAWTDRIPDSLISRSGPGITLTIFWEPVFQLRALGLALGALRVQTCHFFDRILR